MFVGTTGVQRVVERTAALMKEHDTEDVWQYGAIPVDVVQRYLNFHFSVSMDLFGSEVSTNAANYFTSGLKGRWQETKRSDDHRLIDATAAMTKVADGRLVSEEVGALTALNLDLRSRYAAECASGVKRWNTAFEAAGLPHRLTLPHEGFNRQVGVYAGHHVTPAGEVVDAATWESNRRRWLPSQDDLDAVAALMTPVYERGKFAAWIAPPPAGINGQPLDFDYVRVS